MGPKNTPSVAPLLVRAAARGLLALGVLLSAWNILRWLGISCEQCPCFVFHSMESRHVMPSKPPTAQPTIVRIDFVDEPQIHTLGYWKPATNFQCGAFHVISAHVLSVSYRPPTLYAPGVPQVYAHLSGRARVPTQRLLVDGHSWKRRGLSWGSHTSFAKHFMSESPKIVTCRFCHSHERHWHSARKSATLFGAACNPG